MNYIGLEPEPHPNLVSYYQVPIQHTDDGKYIVYLLKNFKRVFTSDTLPSYIKSKLTFANALYLTKISDDDVEPYHFYIFNDNGEEETAWRVSDSNYTVVLPIDNLLELVGLQDNNDTREKSKRKS
jgi:hypothetical protein